MSTVEMNSNKAVPGNVKSTGGAARADLMNNMADRANMTDEEIYNYYSNRGKTGTYDAIVVPQNYRAPEIGAKAMARYLKTVDARILDVAAGTGRLGIELQKLGYSNLDGLDPAEGMLDRARERKVYKNYLQIPFNDTNPDVPSDAYECLGMTGGMGQGLIKCSALPDMARVVNKGGHVIIVMRESCLQEVPEYKDRLEPKMAAMEKEGLWRRLERTVIPRYYFEINGILYVFEVL